LKTSCMNLGSGAQMVRGPRQPALATITLATAFKLVF
jgi:hypothetical protein